MSRDLVYHFSLGTWWLILGSWNQNSKKFPRDLDLGFCQCRWEWTSNNVRACNSRYNHIMDSHWIWCFRNSWPGCCRKIFNFSLSRFFHQASGKLISRKMVWKIWHGFTCINIIQLPYSIKQGEMFKLQATIYNYRSSNAKESFHNSRISLYRLSIRLSGVFSARISRKGFLLKLLIIILKWQHNSFRKVIWGAGGFSSDFPGPYS